jgi:CRP/FNR family transcriptional regulator
MNNIDVINVDLLNVNLWNEYFPQLMQTNDPAIDRIVKKSRLIEIPSRFQVSMPGAECSDYILVVGGSIRVQIVTEKGREVVLYHVHAGEGCILTTSCLLSGTTFPAEGHTEEKTEVLAVPAAEFDLAIGASSHFRNFVFTNFAHRLTSILSRIEQFCSPTIDRSLATALLDLATEGNLITTTHQELANEIGTAREVVSRHLKRLEVKGLLRLGRGTIQIILPQLLSDMTKA